MLGRLYEILELPRKNVTTAEIKKQYNKLASKIHPDRNYAPNANYQFQCLNVAYQILKDEITKNDYDADPEAFDKEIFTKDVSANIPTRIQNRQNSSHISDLVSSYKRNGYSNTDPIKIEINHSSFDVLLNKLLVVYGKIHQGSFIFSRSNLAYAEKFNSIISSVVNEFGATQELLAQRYTALWLIKIMNEGNQTYRYDKTIGGDIDTLRNIFQNVKVKKALSEAAKLIKKNEFLSRLLLLQHINNFIVNNISDESIRGQTEEALKFGIGQLYYHKESINAIMEIEWKGAGYYYHLSLVLLKVALKNFVPYTIIATLCVTSLGFFFATPVVAMTTLGFMVSCLMAATAMLAPLVAITLLAASIAMIVFATKFGNAMQQEKLEIKRTIKETTHNELADKDHYSFFHKSIYGIATKSEIDKMPENSTEDCVSERKRLTN